MSLYFFFFTFFALYVGATSGSTVVSVLEELALLLRSPYTLIVYVCMCINVSINKDSTIRWEDHVSIGYKYSTKLSNTPYTDCK